MAEDKQALQRAGDVDIQGVVITNAAGVDYDIKSYIAEINLFEDMYRPGLYGNIMILDAFNLQALLPLIGEEYFTIKFCTPTMDNSLIFKTFKIYSISDKDTYSDTGKASYVIHFCSPEIFVDSVSPVYKTYSGKIQDVVKKIYEENLGIETKLTIFGETENEVKFTSPGWKPMQAINWLAARAKGAGYENPGYLFFESNKSFYFANVEAIIDNAIKTKAIYNKYVYRANNLNIDQVDPLRYVRNLDDDYSTISELNIVQSYNQLKNTQNGYLANRLITFDTNSKEIKVWDYDHVKNYGGYKHLEDITAIAEVNTGTMAPFSKDTARAPAAMVNFYPKHKFLYTDFANNVNDVIEKTLPRRVSNLNELTNLKLEITVPGRSDVEVGAVIYLYYPDGTPSDETDKSKGKKDEFYSGYYLVTAIRHKINLQKHMMILEIVKDSLHKV